MTSQRVSWCGNRGEIIDQTSVYLTVISFYSWQGAGDYAVRTPFRQAPM